MRVAQSVKWEVRGVAGVSVPVPGDRPHSPEEELYNLADQYDSEGQSGKAREVLKQLLSRNPRHADGWYLLGRIAEQEDRLNEAAEAYRGAITADPSLVDAHFNLGFVYRSQGKPVEALEEFQQMVRLNPAYAEAHMNLGLVYTALRKLDEAERALARAIALKPTLLEAHYNLGILYELHRKEPVKALGPYRRYLELGGRDERVERIVRDVGKRRDGIP
ncbi:MAG: tetratricopeptide repeat protein [Nitrospirales bacterium]